MKISTKGRYGLRAMMLLAEGYGKGPVLTSAIAEDQGISLKYLHALLAALRAAGLVRSLRGTGGGYMLSREPGKINLAQVVSALEGALVVADCVESEEICEQSAACVARAVWQELSRTIEEKLSGMTLRDLVERRAQLMSESDGAK